MEPHLPNHIQDIRTWLSISNSAIPILDPSDLPIGLKSAQMLSENLEDLGLEKIAVLFGDRSKAEIILENCKTFRNKLEYKDWDTCNLIAEAFGVLFNNIPEDKLSLIGLTEGQSNFCQVLNENFNIIPTQINPIDKLSEHILNLISRWESHREIVEDRSSEYAEGIEIGLSRAAFELKELFASEPPRG